MKITCNLLTYVYLFLFIIIGRINYLVNLIIVLFIHEIGHIISIKLCHYKIQEIKLYPCGGIISTNINLNIPSFKLLFISISGILNQIIVELIITNLTSFSNSTFIYINHLILFFNLIPIYPLDGYKIILSLTENITSYRVIIKVLSIISFLITFLFLILTKNIIIFTILYIFNIRFITFEKYYYHKFLLERYLYPQHFSKTKYINSINSLFKSRKNYIKYDNIYTEERDVLFNYFHKYN